MNEVIFNQIRVDFFIPNKAQPYPSEQAAVEQEKVQKKLTAMSAKLNEIDSRKEPFYAFRVTSVKDSGHLQRVNKNPGKMNIFHDNSSTSTV